MISIRRSHERGLAEHGWLKSRHSFSFAEYFDPKHMGFGFLRVINEDWIQGGRGFGAHPHRDMEIITYVVSGSLAHRDSLGNTSVIRPDEVQRMTAGTGIIHSEMNPDPETETHLFQIWIVPREKGLTPGYRQRSFADDLRNGGPVLVVSPDGRLGSIPINQDVAMSIVRLENGNDARIPLDSRRAIWVQVVSGEVSVSGLALGAGDAAAIHGDAHVHLGTESRAEALIFDLAFP